METRIDLIKKYNRPVPRYTSYPPVPYWSHTPTESEWIGHLKANYNSCEGIDLYVHVPFCESLCYYCGCNRTITKNHDVESHFLQLVQKEWNLYKSKLGFTPKINSLHFGGGTPTFLSAKHLDELLASLVEESTDTFIGSIEIDPRTIKEEHFQVLKKSKITRVSLGIQDFNLEVQRAINRFQSPELVEKLVKKLRAEQFDSINFDLIYGLPKQTTETINETFAIVGELRPDTIAFYSYAHLPEKIKNQKLINEADLPTPEIKRELYLAGKKILEDLGYIEIGMDHFALPESFLYQAMLSKKLHRNFMGYVDKKSKILIGLGPTSISDSSISFIQNAKDNKTYEEILNKDQLPITSGHTHNSEDLLIQKLLLQLLCHQEIDLPEKSLIPYWENIEKELEDFHNEGLIDLNTTHLKLKNEGRAFVRNVALCFDYHHRSKNILVKFSQSI